MSFIAVQVLLNQGPKKVWLQHDRYTPLVSLSSKYFPSHSMYTIFIFRNTDLFFFLKKTDQLPHKMFYITDLIMS